MDAYLSSRSSRHRSISGTSRRRRSDSWVTSSFREVDAGKIHEFQPSRDENSVESREFWQKVDDLAQEMKALLERRTSAPSTRAATIYLAETTGDVRLARDAIRRDLGQRGYRVVRIIHCRSTPTISFP